MITRFALGLGISEKEGVWKVEREGRKVCWGFGDSLWIFKDAGRFWGRW